MEADSARLEKLFVDFNKIENKVISMENGMEASASRGRN